jgi:hypothetical protein
MKSPSFIDFINSKNNEKADKSASAPTPRTRSMLMASFETSYRVVDSFDNFSFCFTEQGNAYA